jgi:beta-glucanase (GH16 family)
MLPKQDEWPPEIDIYESINSESRYFVNYHWSSGGNRQYHDDGPHPVNADTSQWHTYGVEWSPGLLVFTLDGAEVGRATQGVSQLDAARPMYLIMNVAMGGDWAGSPNGSTPEVNDMLVDWVRIYQR